MSDIVERLRNWRTVHLARLHLLMEEAADEIERLSRTGSNSRQTGDEAAECRSQSEKTPERERVANHPATPDSSTLTDAEREAVEWYAAYGAGDHAATLRGLLERLSPPAT